MRGGKGRLEGGRMMIATMKQPLGHEGKVGRPRQGWKQSINQCHATSQNSKDLKNSQDFLIENMPTSLNSSILISCL